MAENCNTTSVDLQGSNGLFELTTLYRRKAETAYKDRFKQKVMSN